MMSDYGNISARLALLDAMSEKVGNMMFRIDIARLLNGADVYEPSEYVSSEDILTKIREFLESEPTDEMYEIFLRYLAHYPVSLCSRKVTPLLKMLIGFHYRLGKPNKKQKAMDYKAVSYSELSQIFGRSKATISEAVNETKDLWQEAQEDFKRHEEVEKVKAGFREDARTRGIALAELIEEEKANLKQDIVVSQ